MTEPSLSPRQETIGALTVALSSQPDPPNVDQWTTLTFRYVRDGEPVTSFPSAAQHHLVAISADTKELVYGHSTIGEATGGMRAEMHLPVDELHSDESVHTPIDNGRLTYHIRFTRPGRYKLWCEAAAGERAASFVVDVPPSRIKSDPFHNRAR